MNMKDQPFNGNSEASSSDVLRRVQSLVQDMLNDGAAAADISFVLAFIATDLGLALSPDPVAVFPVVLNGVGQAASNRLPESVEGAEHSGDASEVAGNSTVH
jgi:hypothetical protein